MIHTLFEASQRDIWVLHIDLALEVHIGEALDDISLPPLGDGMVERRHEKLEGGILDVLLP